MNWKPYAVVAAALVAATITSDARSDWTGTGLDDNGWYEYRMTEKPFSDTAKIEYYHYGTGESETIWMQRTDETLDFMRQRTPRLPAYPWRPR